MTVWANIGELAASVVDYAHTPELLERATNVFIPLVAVRLGRDLESSANEETTTLDPEVDGDWPIQLPSDFGRIRSVVWNGKYALRSRGEAGFYTIEGSNGDPMVYNIRDGALDVRPRSTGKFELNYYAIPDDAMLALILARHPQLLLYGALIELYVWTQDEKNRRVAEGFYQGELRMINRSERRGRKSSPQAIGAT